MKKLKLSLALAAIFASTFSTALIVNAAEADSNANVTFTSNTDAVAPVDPLNPDQPGAGGGTGMTGSLTLDYVPTLPFGTHEITGNVETYDSTNAQPYVQVTDKSGTGAGWTLTAQLGAFTSADTLNTLPAARIDFKNSNVLAPTSNTSLAPTGSNFSLTSGSGTPTEVLSASTDQGMGTWVETWLSDGNPITDTANSNVQLTVNTSNAYAKVYTGLITWNIQVAP